MRADDEFYVGYDDSMPAGLRRFTRRVLATAFLAATVAAAAIVSGLAPLPASRFEFGAPRTFSGRILERPYPRLIGRPVDPSAPAEDAASTPPTNQPGGASPKTGEPRVWLLAGQGKRGAEDLARGFDQTAVRFEATLAERGGQGLLQVESANLHGSGAEGSSGGSLPPAPPLTPLGRRTLRGEIVDSKCFLGVMNPGEGAVHRDCAVRCVAGGIAPALLARDFDGATQLLFLSTPEGGPLDAKATSSLAGRQVQVTGDIVSEGDLLWLRVEPLALRTLP